jgi:hypothetical protein
LAAPSDAVSNPAGHQMTTWGTAYQNFQTQAPDDDNSDILTSLSNVNTSAIAKNYQKLEAAVLQ